MTSDPFANIELSKDVNETLKSLGILKEKIAYFPIGFISAIGFVFSTAILICVLMLAGKIFEVYYGHMPRIIGSRWPLLSLVGLGLIIGGLIFRHMVKQRREEILAKSPGWKKTKISAVLLDHVSAKIDWLKDEAEFGRLLDEAKDKADRLEKERDTIKGAIEDAENSQEEKRWRNDLADIKARLAAIKGTIADLEEGRERVQREKSACEEAIPDLAENYERQAVARDENTTEQLRSDAENLVESMQNRLQGLTQAVEEANNRARNMEI